MRTHRQYVFFVIAVVSLAIITSCKSTKNTAKNSDTPTPPPAAKTLTAKDINNADFSTLSMNFSTELMGVNVSGQVRIQKDKIIWASVSKLLELGRVKMTPDSVYATIKVKNQAFQGTYAQFQKQFGIAINFDIAQALLTGNDLAGYQQTGSQSEVANNVTTISFPQRKSSKQTIAVKHDMQIDNRTRKVLSHTMISANPSQKVKADYSDFQNFGKIILPTIADIDISSPNAGRVTARLNYSKIQINPQLTFPISISKRAKAISF